MQRAFTIIGLLLLLLMTALAQQPVAVRSLPPAAGAQTSALSDSIVPCTTSGNCSFHVTPVQSGFTTDFDTTITALPNTLTSATTSTVYIGSMYCNNTDSSARSVTITDSANHEYVSAFSIPANSNIIFWGNSTRGLKMVGVKWNSDVASKVNCQATGLQ